MEEYNEKEPLSYRAVRFFKNNFETIFIILISIAYIFAGVLKIIPSGKSISSIISGSIINLIVGVLIKSLMRNRGLRDGQNSEVFVRTVQLYGKKLDDNTQYITRLDLYCDFYNDRKLKRAQLVFLRKHGLNYDDFVAGKYDNDEKLSKIIKKCRNLKIKKLNSIMMLNAINIVDVEDRISSTTPSKYQARGIGMNIIIGALIAFLFAYYLPEEGTFKLTVILWATLQVIINLTFGILGYIGAVNFVKNELRTRVKFIINCFDEFESLNKKHFFDKQEEELEEEIKSKFSNYAEGE